MSYPQADVDSWELIVVRVVIVWGFGFAWGIFVGNFVRDGVRRIGREFGGNDFGIDGKFCGSVWVDRLKIWAHPRADYVLK